MPRSMYVKTKNIFDETSWSEPIYVDLYFPLIPSLVSPV